MYDPTLVQCILANWQPVDGGWLKCCLTMSNIGPVAHPDQEPNIVVNHWTFAIQINCITSHKSVCALAVKKGA